MSTNVAMGVTNAKASPAWLCQLQYLTSRYREADTSTFWFLEAAKGPHPPPTSSPTLPGHIMNVMVWNVPLGWAASGSHAICSSGGLEEALEAQPPPSWVNVWLRGSCLLRWGWLGLNSGPDSPSLAWLLERLPPSPRALRPIGLRAHGNGGGGWAREGEASCVTTKQNDHDLIGIDLSAETTGPDLGLDLSASKHPELILGSGSVELGLTPNKHKKQCCGKTLHDLLP